MTLMIPKTGSPPEGGGPFPISTAEAVMRDFMQSDYSRKLEIFAWYHGIHDAAWDVVVDLPTQSLVSSDSLSRLQMRLAGKP